MSISDIKKHLLAGTNVELTVWDPERDDIEHTFHSFVEEVTELKFKIAGPPLAKADEIMPLMLNKSTVGIMLQSEPNPYIFYPVVHSHEVKKTSSYWLRIPENTVIQEYKTRSHVRVAARIPLEIAFQLGNKTLFVQGVTENISGGGLRFTAPRVFLKNQNIRMNIKLNDVTPMIRVNAKVIASGENRQRMTTQDVYFAACQFVDLERQHETEIMRECFRREVQKKHVPTTDVYTPPSPIIRPPGEAAS